MDWQRVGMQVAFLALFALGTLGFRAVRIAERDRWYVGLVWLIAVAFGADLAGLHFMLGAFLAEEWVDVEWFDQERMDRSSPPLSRSWRSSSAPAADQLDVGGVAVFVAAGPPPVAAVAGKLAGVHLPGRILPAGRR